MTIHDFAKMKQTGKKISMITCYDYTLAKIVNTTDIDIILVGDSLAMVMHGHPTTVPATIELMTYHTQAVVRGAPDKFIIGDMPFCSYRKGLDASMNAVQSLMQAGAHAIKLEGVTGNEGLIRHIVGSGVPVMGHIGLTPQSVHQLGGFKVQGKEKDQADNLIAAALTLQDAGCFAIVLECVPNALAKTITAQLTIPTIGIGGGQHTSGQVLVLQDMLGMQTDFQPKFLKTYLNGFELIKKALNQYDNEVKQAKFPSKEHCYSE